MKNPFSTLKRYIRWEIMDLEAIIDSIEQKNDLVKIKNQLGIQITKNGMQLLKLQKGTYQIKNAFKTKSGKVD